MKLENREFEFYFVGYKMQLFFILGFCLSPPQEPLRPLHKPLASLGVIVPYLKGLSG